MSEAAGTKLANALLMNTTLASFTFSSSHFMGLATARAFAMVLRESTTLKSFNLLDANAGDMDDTFGAVLASALARNSTLEHFSIHPTCLRPIAWPLPMP